jgi:GNAT superfamily N-acetyltransferase
VGTLVQLCTDAGLPPAVQLSSWAPEATVAALGAAGFVPAWCRSVLAVRPTVRGGRRRSRPGPAADGADRASRPQVEIVEVGEDPVRAAGAADVMVAEHLAGGGERAVSDEFMAADRVAAGTTQLLALLDGRPVGCGSLTVVRDGGLATGWLGAAATVPAARGRGVQTALVRHRLRLAAEAGCDLVGVTASVGTTSARVLQRCGFVLCRSSGWYGRASRLTPDGCDAAPTASRCGGTGGPAPGTPTTMVSSTAG